jgi:hypothetical protein
MHLPFVSGKDEDDVRFEIVLLSLCFDAREMRQMKRRALVW